MIYDDYVPRQGILTPKTQVSYVVAFPDLEKTGRWCSTMGRQRLRASSWITGSGRFSTSGHRAGKGATGGKVLILGPGQKCPARRRRLSRRAHTDPIRVYRLPHSGPRETEKLTPLNRLYPYRREEHPPPPKVLAALKDYTQSQPRGLAYWEAVHELIQREPVEERDRFFLAMLRDLGIEKGKPFTPDDHQKTLLEDAALLGEELAKLIVYEKRFIGNYYRPDARWQFALVVDPDQRADNFDQLDERTDWFYEAIASSYAMITKTPGVGSIYLSTYRDKDGDWLDGGKSYRLRLAPSADAAVLGGVGLRGIHVKRDTL